MGNELSGCKLAGASWQSACAPCHRSHASQLKAHGLIYGLSGLHASLLQPQTPPHPRVRPLLPENTGSLCQRAGLPIIHKLIFKWPLKLLSSTLPTWRCDPELGAPRLNVSLHERLALQMILRCSWGRARYTEDPNSTRTCKQRVQGGSAQGGGDASLHSSIPARLRAPSWPQPPCSTHIDIEFHADCATVPQDLLDCLHTRWLAPCRAGVYMNAAIMTRLRCVHASFLQLN